MTVYHVNVLIIVCITAGDQLDEHFDFLVVYCIIM